MAVTTPCCPTNPISDLLSLQVTSLTCAQVLADGLMNLRPDSYTWVYETQEKTYTLTCNGAGADWGITYTPAEGTGFFLTVPASAVTCDPFRIEFNYILPPSFAPCPGEVMWFRIVPAA